MPGQPSVTLGRNASGKLLDAANGQELLTATLDGAVAGVVLDSGGAVYNVKHPLYGAKGDGITDDTTAIVSAITACNAAGGGTVFLPYGTYLTSAQLTTPNSGVSINIVGAGRSATKITTNTALSGYVLRHLCNGEVADLTVDGGGVASGGFIQGNLNGQGTTFLTQAARRCTFQNIAAGSAAWVAVWWDLNSTYQCRTVHVEDVIIAGPAATNTDAAAWSYIDRLFVKNLTFTGLQRSPNFYIVNDLFIDGLFSDGCPATATFVIDYLVKRAVVSNVVVDATNANGTPIIIGTPYLLATNWNTTLPANPTGGQVVSSPAQVAGATWLFNNCKLNGIAWSVAMRLVSCVNCDLFAQPTGQCLRDQSAAATVTTHVRLVDCTLDASAFNFNVFGATNAVTWTKLTAVGNEFLRIGAVITSANITVTNPIYDCNQGALADSIITGHLVSTATGTPATSNLGANVTSATFTGNDTRGTIAIVMSAGLAANTRVCTVTFATTYGTTVPKVSLIDQTSTAGLAIVNSYVMAGATGAAFDIAFDQALVAGTYTIDYIVIG